MSGGRKRSFLRAMLITGGIGLFFFVLIFGAAALLSNREHFGGPKMALVKVDGIISDSEEVIEQIRHHLENPTVQAFVIRINSPGGGVAASQETRSWPIRGASREASESCRSPISRGFSKK